MKTRLILIGLLVYVSALAVGAQKDGSPRTSILINDGWSFAKADDARFADPAYKGGSWTKVAIPHTWNVKDTFDDEPLYRRGASWYRRELRIPAALKGKRIFLYFEGVNQVADLYVNGKHIGQHIGGYTAFTFDITDHLGSSNVIALRVDNSFNVDIPPLTADFNFYGGIYRNVKMIAVDPMHIKVDNMASSGLEITTPNENGERNTVRVVGTVKNTTSSKRKFEVINTVLDATGKKVAESTSSGKVDTNAEIRFINQLTPVANRRLWSPDDPYLYTLETTIKEKGKVLDKRSDKFGFRWFEIGPDKGFLLNGKPIKLRGTNRHQDYLGMGFAVPDALQVKDMEIIKDAGFNFVRLAHYPQSPAILEAADRLGLLIWEEIPIVNYVTISDKFNQNSEVMLREMIRQHRNHPSVVMWGYMNEIFLRTPKENEENIKKATVALAQRLDDVSHEEDPTRPTTIAFHGSEVYNTTGLGEIADITGWNLYNGWYSKTFEDFGKFMDDQHKRYPNRPLIISEYGANGDLRLHSTNTRRFDSTIEYQRMFHESYMAQMNARPYIAGMAIWNQFDFAAELRGETIPHLNQKGMLTYDRKPKDIHYFYKANYSTKPVLHIATRDWALRGGTDDAPAKIDVYTNMGEVELLHNGVSLGKKRPNDIRKIVWEAVLKNGKNVLTARGKTGGKKAVSDSTTVIYKRFTLNSAEIAVNVGSNAQFIDENKVIWLADQAYKAGSWGYIGKDIKTIYSEPPDRNVLGTLDDPLFQTMQENLTSYRFDVPAGSYEIELLFAEMKFNQPGERVFSIKLNKKPVLENIDLARDPGPQKAVVKQLTYTGNEGIRIDLVAVKGRPVLSGIKIRRL